MYGSRPASGHSTLLSPIVFVVLVLLSASPVRADTVVLTDHDEHTGAIISEDENAVTIRSGGQEWTFTRSTVASVTHDKASADAELATDKRRAERADAERAREAREAEAEARAARAATPAQGASRTTKVAPSMVFDRSQVVVYGTSWCRYCQRARSFLSHRGVAFLDKNVEMDLDANHEMQQKCAAAHVSSNGVPVLDVYGTILHGFDQRRVDALLAEHGQ